MECRRVLFRSYSITSNTALFTIGKATASVTPNAAGKTYGATDPALSGMLAGFVAADNVTATYTRTAGETVAGSPYTISPTLSPANVLGNYNITSNTALFTIGKATASEKRRVAEESNAAMDPELYGVLDGIVAEDSVTET